MSMRFNRSFWKYTFAAAVAGALFVSTPATFADKKSDKADERKEERSMNRDFLKTAYQSGLAEVQVSQLAHDNSDNSEIKGLADMMITDHEKANKEIEDLAATRHMTLEKKITDKDDMKHDNLARMKGKDFDKQFLKTQLDMHNQAIELFEKAEKDSTDPQVDKFVKDTLPTLRMHHQKIEDMMKSMS